MDISIANVALPHIAGGLSAGVDESTYRRFGSRVTVIETGPRVMGREDPDIAEAIHSILSEEGIEFVLAA